jgi:hypothetical protein
MNSTNEASIGTWFACIFLTLASLVSSSNAEATVFGLKSCGSNSSGFCGSGIINNSLPPTYLFSFQENGVGFDDIGSVTLDGISIDADALAYSDEYGLIAFDLTKSGFATTGSSLITIDPSTAIATSGGTTLEGRDIRGAVFDQLNTLWALDSFENELLQIDPTTGLISGTPVSLILGGDSFDLSDVTDIAVDSDGFFYLADSANFYSIDVLTGALTLLSSDLGQGFAGLTFSNNTSDNMLFTYEVNGTDDIYRYDMNSSFARTSLYPNIISSFNSGRGDLASYIEVQSVPEPTTLVLLIYGCMALFALQRNNGRVHRVSE